MKKRILKVILGIMIIICFIFGCLTIYKFTIINKIFNTMELYVAKENYYMKMITGENEEDYTETYYKDGIGKQVASNGIYTWAKGEEAYLVDEENKSIYELSTDSIGLMSNEAVASMIPGYSKNIVERFFLAGKLTTSIKKENNGIQYYVITTEDKFKRTIWIACDTLIPVQSRMENKSIQTVCQYEITFDIVKDEDVMKPNLEEYHINPSNE